MNIDLGLECIPSFVDIDADGDYDMFLGDEDGYIHYYRNDGTPEQYDFVLVSNSYMGIDVGLLASPSFCDIDADGDYDLFVGERSWGEDNRRGDIDYYENIGTPEAADYSLVTQNFIGIDVGLATYISFADLDNDGLADMFIGDGDGNIGYFSNIGSDSIPAFSLTEENFQNLWICYQSRPTFGDLDGDGDLDMIVGRTSGFVGNSLYLYRNDGTAEVPVYTLIDDDFLDINFGYAAPRLIDIDGDGDLDLFAGSEDNLVTFWENAGTSTEMRFVFVTDNYLNTTAANNYCSVCFGDLDSDGDYDLLRGHQNATVSYYENTGNAQNPNFVLSEDNFLAIDGTLYSDPYLIDIDNDNDLDLFVGDACGGISFWRNNEVNGVAERPFDISPLTFSLEPCYPNPFNPTTTISFTLNKALPVKLSVYDISGRLVGTQNFASLQPGQHTFLWNAEGCGSGVYFVRAEAGACEKSQKVILLK